MQAGEAFGPLVRRLTVAALLAGALGVGASFFAQFHGVWTGEVQDVLMGPSLDDGLLRRQKWVRTVRAAAAMQDHCQAVLSRAQAGVREAIAPSRIERRPPARKALRAKLQRLADEVRPCESAELFLKLAGKDQTFPHVVGLYKFFAGAARLLADGHALRPDERQGLSALRAAWQNPVPSRPETRTRSVLGVIVRGPTWYVQTDAQLAFHGSTAEAWQWLSGVRAAARP